MQLQLPQPSSDALSASHELQTAIFSEIAGNGGWISFARYMDLVLYAPRLGYYSGGSAKLGKDGDFTTAPEMTPLFGQTLARAIEPLLAQSAPYILEFGAGSGRLALDMLQEFQSRQVPIQGYQILELSSELRQRQQETLRDFPQVTWLDALPPAFSGVIVGNEVLDAMPVHLVVKTGQGWCERGVAIADGKLGFSDRPLDMTDASVLALLAQIPEADTLPVGYLTEVHPLARGFVQSVGSMLVKGAALFVDYGFPAHEYYFEQRSRGTLMCHYRHHAHDDPFFLPGLQDITAHVDFTDIARTALECGLDLIGYMSQAAFLLQAGLPELLKRTDAADVMRYLPQANAVQKLTSPAEMGELFKVIMLGRDVRLADSLLAADRSHRL